MSVYRETDSPSRVKHFYARPGFVVELCFQLLLCHRMASNNSSNTTTQLSSSHEQADALHRFQDSKSCARIGSGDVLPELLTGGTLIVNRRRRHNYDLV